MSREYHVAPGYTPYFIVVLVASSCQVLANQTYNYATTKTSTTAMEEPSTSDDTITDKTGNMGHSITPLNTTDIPGQTNMITTTTMGGGNIATLTMSQTVTNTTEQSTKRTEITAISSTLSTVGGTITVSRTDSTTTEQATMTTTESPVPGPPANLISTPLNSSSIRLQWDVVPDADEYGIRWQAAYTDATNKTVGENEIDVVITDLQPSTEYQFNVSAIRNGKVGEPAITTATTHPRAPGPPTNISVECGENEMNATWSPPNLTNGRITGYRISVADGDCPYNQPVEEWKTVYETQYSNTSLLAATNYSFSVCAFIQWNGTVLNGAVECTGFTTNEGLPSIPSALKCMATSSRTVVVSWGEPKTRKGAITHYNVSHCEVVWLQCILPKYSSATSKSFTITDLKPDTSYEIKVAAWTSKGQGDWTENVTCKTEAEVPSVPSDLKCVERTSRTITISWKEPQPWKGNVTYDVNHCKTEQPQCSPHVYSSTSSQSWTLTDLEPDTSYRIKVAARTSKGQGDWSMPLTCSTTAEVPKPPFEVVAKDTTSTRITFRWNRPDGNPGRITYYWDLYELRKPCETKEERIRFDKTEKDKVEIENLQPYSDYRIEVFAGTTAGNSTAAVGTGQTTPTTPEAIENLKLDCSFSSNAVSISWSPPGKPNGKITNYQIQYKGEKGNKKDEVKSLAINVTKPCREMRHTLHHLLPEYTYIFSVSAKVRGVVNLSSPASETCTLPAGLPPPPQKNITVIERLQKKIKFVIQNGTFLETGGEIVKYAVVVAAAENIGWNESKLLNDAEELSKWSEFQSNDSLRYQATPDDWNPFIDKADDPMKCTIESDAVMCILGCEVECDADKYCNGPLTPGMSYGIKLRGYTKVGFAETFPVVAETTSESLASIKSLLIIILVTAFLVFGVAAAVYLYHRWGGDRPNRFFAVLSPRRLLKSTVLSRTTASQNNAITPTVDADNARPVKVTEFLKHVNDMMADSRLKFSIEFEQLKKLSPLHPFTAAQLADNRSKNRWINILPFDHSRVKLLPIDDEPASDYINASYIPGFTCHREYIASQGPLPGTVDDMWRMIWEQGVNTIVMLTQCVERGKAKCQQYWPEEKTDTAYGDLLVQTMCQSVLSEYTVRTFDLSLDSRHRIVTQMHFTKWPDFGCPDNTESLINFVRAVRDHVPEADASPLLVHCSAGVGRTGTFIAIDRLMQHIDIHDYADVFHTVLDMREHRTNMVQTEDQYVYIHECVRDLIQGKLARETDTFKNDSDRIYGNICAQVTTNV